MHLHIAQPKVYISDCLILKQSPGLIDRNTHVRQLIENVVDEVPEIGWGVACCGVVI